MTARSVVFGRFQRAHALISLLWRVARWRAVALGLLALVLGALPPLTVLAVGRLVAAIPAAVRYGLSAPRGVDALWALALVAAGFILTGLGETASRYFGTELGIRYVTGTWDLLASAARELRGISELEDPDVVATLGMLDDLDRREVQRAAPAALAALITARTQGLGAAALLFGFRWWAPFVLYAGWTVASVTGARWFASGLGRAVHAGSEGLHRAEYFRQLGMGAAFAKEVRIFGLGGWIRGEYAGHWRKSMAEVWRGRRWDSSK